MREGMLLILMLVKSWRLRKLNGDQLPMVADYTKLSELVRREKQAGRLFYDFFAAAGLGAILLMRRWRS